MKKRLILLLFCLTGFNLSVSQAAYITDKLVAGLYEKAEVSDKPIKALNSGTPLEVVSRKDDFVKVRTSDGAIGWVEASYLTDEKPARSMLLDIQSKVSILQKQLEQAKGKQASDVGTSQASGTDIVQWQEKLAKAEGKIAQLGIQLKAAKLDQQEKQKDQMDAKLKAAQSETEALRQQIKQVAKILNVELKSNESVGYFEMVGEKGDVEKTNYVAWIVLAVGIILGFLVGFAYMQRKVSQRFGSAFRL